jgi:hypothetical protein
MSYQIIDDGGALKLKALADGAVFPLDERGKMASAHAQYHLLSGYTVKMSRSTAAA